MRVLGIDASLRSTGVGVVQADGNKLSAVYYGTIKTGAKEPRSVCLANLGGGIGEVIGETDPDVAVIEGTFYAKNVKTSMILGEARGAMISVCVLRGLPVYEYSPRKVKQALTGSGSASKRQVCSMVTKILGLDSGPQEDAGDALAMAICHLHNRGKEERL